MKEGGAGHHCEENIDSPWPCLAKASATKLPSLGICTQTQAMLWQKLRQLCHLTLICQGIPTILWKALTTLRESVSKQILLRPNSIAFSIAIMQAQNSASRGVAWPMLLERAPKNPNWESLITIPIAPLGYVKIS